MNIKQAFLALMCSIVEFVRQIEWVGMRIHYVLDTEQQIVSDSYAIASMYEIANSDEPPKHVLVLAHISLLISLLSS